MQVSVIIPFYKGKSWLIEAINSVKNQSYPHWTIYLINDGSDEDINEVIYLVPEGKIIILDQKNSGAANARNNGIEVCKGDLVAFLDADDLWEPNKLEVQVKLIKSSNYNWVHSAYVRVNEDNTKELDTPDDFLEGEVFLKSLLRCTIATPTVLIRKEILSDPNLRFVSNLRSGEDTIFWLKLLLKYPVGLISKPLVKVRMRGANASMDINAQLEGRNAINQFLQEINQDGIEFRLIKTIYIYISFIYSFNFSSLLKKIFYFPAWITFKFLYKIK